MGLALKCVNKSTVYLPKNKYADFQDKIYLKYTAGDLGQCALKPPPHLRVVQIIHLLLMNYRYLVLELHKQEPWYSNNIVGFKPLPPTGANGWSKYNCRSPSEIRPEGHSWESNKKNTSTKVLPESYELTTMTSVSVRFEEMTASHRFELLQNEIKDDLQQ